MRLHAKKKSSLLLKIDIVWAFDSVAWPFLLELLQHMAFPNAGIGSLPFSPRPAQGFFLMGTRVIGFVTLEACIRVTLRPRCSSWLWRC
jgi:hypothetical protein